MVVGEEIILVERLGRGFLDFFLMLCIISLVLCFCVGVFLIVVFLEIDGVWSFSLVLGGWGRMLWLLNGCCGGLWL